MEWPGISIIMPTLNSGTVLEMCLKSINSQDYPKDKVEIVIADGGSTDDTLAIAKSFGAKIVPNPLRTSEAGKAVAFRNSKFDLIASIDSDNVLPTENWLKEMVEPLIGNVSYPGSEPWSYTCRKEDGFITRYCALIGMNDPFVLFLGLYDRLCLLTGKWTEVAHEEKDRDKYLLVDFKGNMLPTIGGNGTVFRRSFLEKKLQGDYLFDIDMLVGEKLGFIKVKNGIVHLYCGSDIKKFIRKQYRRLRDYLFYASKKDRKYNWSGGRGSQSYLIGTPKFILYCLLVFPLIFQSIRGFSKKPDFAWFFHPLACELTLVVYAYVYLLSLFNKQEASRANWSQ